MASYTVIYDANVLYPSVLRDLLIRVAQARLVRARWTDRILDETFRNLVANRPDLDPRALARTRTLMNEAIPDVLVTGYEPLIGILDLPDPDDRHVLAAAIKVGAQMIVTDNLRAFRPTDWPPGTSRLGAPTTFCTRWWISRPSRCSGSSNAWPMPAPGRRWTSTNCSPPWTAQVWSRRWLRCGPDPDHPLCSRFAVNVRGCG